jgi:hypothetical protein
VLSAVPVILKAQPVSLFFESVEFYIEGLVLATSAAFHLLPLLLIHVARQAFGVEIAESLMHLLVESGATFL